MNARQTTACCTAWALLVWMAAFVGTTPSLVATAKTPPEPAEVEFEDLAPGLIAEFSDSTSKTYRRIDEEPCIAWDDLDLRLKPGRIKIRWTGYLNVQLAGEHRFYAFAWNKIRLKLSGAPLIDGLGPVKGEPISLAVGFHRFELTAEGETSPKDFSGGPNVRLFWSGPGFGQEPVPGRLVYHDAPAEDDASKVGNRFEHGRQLARALRCASCHDLPAAGELMRVPALDKLSGNLHADWASRWLDDELPDETAGAVNRRMPHFKLSSEESQLLAEYLCSQSEKAAAKPHFADQKNQEAGRLLTMQVGCLACHSLGKLGARTITGGGDLLDVAQKRPTSYFERWLTSPDTINRDHRMPVFELTGNQVGQISTYLQTLRASERPRATPVHGADTPIDTAQARTLLVQQRCNACHRLPGEPLQTVQKSILTIERITADSGCMSSSPSDAHPAYALTTAERTALHEYLAWAAKRVEALRLRRVSPRDLLLDNGCFSCHSRGTGKGIGDSLASLAAAEPKFANQIGTMAAPSLDSVGDKLTHEALTASIARTEKPHRDWLAIQMPKFRLSKDEVDWMVDYLWKRDSWIRFTGPVEDLDNSDADTFGPRLVSSRGFGCTSCHQVGDWKPQGVALNARGPDLLGLDKRINRDWFDRWVRNPARIVPRMEMPAVQQPIRGVLDDDLDQQLSAVWQSLNSENFKLPDPSDLRVVRCENRPDGNERSQLVTDVVELGDRTIVRAIVVGLPNRHNVLFDAERGELAAWWLGDTARQRTRGKSWYWQAGGTPVFQSASAKSELYRRTGGSNTLEPANGFALDSIQHIERGIEFAGRVQFGNDQVLIRQRFQRPALTTGFDALYTAQRTITLTGVPGAKYWLRVVPNAVGVPIWNGSGAKYPLSTGVWSVKPHGRTARLAAIDESLAIPVHLNVRGVATSELEYSFEQGAEAASDRGEFDRSVTQQSLDVVPGFEAIRLPVTDQAMPTGLTWTNDGVLTLCSLEGRVWQARDTNGDGLEDQLLPISDTYPAPYGIAATPGGAIDLLSKFGLVRLEDRTGGDTEGQGDGFFEKATVIADGWGYTADYHDWAVGLPRDTAGNYYVALPCQQDDRTEEQAMLRGTILKLVPRQLDKNNQRLFDIEPLASGARFPMGLALSPNGDLFASDNQGNYTPFNELNHIQPGKRYGFVNKLDAKRGVVSDPHERAAVEIPHPWTRSVNGICFLTTPDQNEADGGNQKPFGDWTGHLLGCEYDTRRLVRMNLEQVDGVYQGGVYPASREPRPGEPTLEGPLVCQVSPRGDIYIGNIRDSGWGAGSNTGSLVRLRYQGQLPPGIAEITASPSGFRIKLTQPAERAKAESSANYSISSFRRTPTPAYGGPDEDRRAESIKQLTVSEDHKSIDVQLTELRPGFVYEFRLRPLASGEFFPDEAYYTLRKVPKK